MNKLCKILTVLLLAVMLVSFTSNVVFAENVGGLDFGDPKQTLDSNSTLMQKVANIMGMIRNIAIIASVIVIMVLGIKYIMGSVEEKAEYKKSFMPLIIGIILVVSATAIASFIFKLVG